MAFTSPFSGDGRYRGGGVLALHSLAMAASDSNLPADPRELAALLAWQVAAGADEAILDDPANRFQAAPPLPPRPMLSEAHRGAPERFARLR